MQTSGFRAMNTTVMLAGEGESAAMGMQAVKWFIDESEQRFSRFLPGSELTQLNCSAGDWFQASDDLIELLGLSRKFYVETDGLFDPSILPDLKRMGYDRSMDEIRAGGTLRPAPASERSSQPAFNEIIFDSAGKRIRLPRGMEIDLGGIAKGWIVNKAARLLNTFVGVCAVSVGGDMLFIGHPSDGLDWDVFMEDPRNPEQMLTELHVASGAVATSSIAKRTWNQGETPRHHLIDPRTGQPAASDWLSVTVIHPDVTVAEIYAKALLIAGEAGSAKLLKERNDLIYLAVDPQGRLSGSPGYKDYVYEFTSEAIEH